MEDGETRIALCSLYLLFGIAMIAMSFNLVQEEVGSVCIITQVIILYILVSTVILFTPFIVVIILYILTAIFTTLSIITIICINAC